MKNINPRVSKILNRIERKVKANLPDVIILGCILLLYLVTYFAYLHPMMVTRETLKGEVEATTNYLYKAKKRLDALIKEIKDAEVKSGSKKSKTTSISKNKYEFAKKLQEYLNKKASDVGASITRFSVGRTKRVKGCHITTVSVSLTGDIKGLVEILKALEKYSYVRVKRLSVSRSYSARRGPLRMDMTIEGLSREGG